MYNFFIHIYHLGIIIAGFFNKKAKKLHRGELATLSLLPSKIDRNEKYLWFHAASLGEFEQGRSVIEQLHREHPQYKIILTFFSPSGYEVRKDYKGADIVCYLPIDTCRNAKKFIDTVRPVAAFFIKYEFWYNYLRLLRKRNIPAYSLCSIFRRNQIFFKWYNSGYANVLKCITYFFVQNKESKQLLGTLGFDNVKIVGDTRFDRVLQIKEASRSLPIIEAFSKNSLVLVAGSTWPPDEEIIAEYISRHPEMKLIIAPHVVSEKHVSRLSERIKLPTARYSKTTVEQVIDARCIIIDGYGLLSSIYHYGNIAYVGGGFGAGIHNVLEAAVWNIPVIFGPNNGNFREAQGLKAVNGGFEINGYENFSLIMDQLIADKQRLDIAGKNAGKYVVSLTGATNLICDSIDL